MDPRTKIVIKSTVTVQACLIVIWRSIASYRKQKRDIDAFFEDYAKRPGGPVWNNIELPTEDPN